MSYAIRVENLGKKYRLGATHAGSVRELLHRAWTGLFGRKHDPLPHELAQEREISGRTLDDDGAFWALRDIAFEVQPGEVVGIIGRNGSGKSTLLKILSQITAPTTGRVELHGRVASLLEVGTGFHPELSGRENVFLNGAILGMTRPEIRRKFDEIVAFAEIEKFIDTPVKRYSSGMYVRLAFAVAAHLEPEILVIDEVLAVGDAEFQSKCLGKMEKVAETGRTILFVSHNMFALKKICATAIWLDHGQTRAIGSLNDIVNKYLFEKTQTDARVCFDNGTLDCEAAILAMTIQQQNGKATTTVPFDEGLCVAIEYVLSKPLSRYRVSLEIRTLDGVLLSVSTTEDSQKIDLPSEPGHYTASIKIPGGILGPGEYLLGCCLDQPTVKVFDDHANALRVSVTGNPLPRARRWEGIVSLSPKWQIS